MSHSGLLNQILKDFSYCRCLGSQTSEAGSRHFSASGCQKPQGQMLHFLPPCHGSAVPTPLLSSWPSLFLKTPTTDLQKPPEPLLAFPSHYHQEPESPLLLPTPVNMEGSPHATHHILPWERTSVQVNSRSGGSSLLQNCTGFGLQDGRWIDQNEKGNRSKVKQMDPEREENNLEFNKYE